MRKLFIAILIVGMMFGCATYQLPTESTWQQRVDAVCSDLQASILLAQIGLSYAQSSNYEFDYTQAQLTLAEASHLISTSCLAAKSESDLVKMRGAVLAALAKATQEQAAVKKWK